MWRYDNADLPVLASQTGRHFHFSPRLFVILAAMDPALPDTRSQVALGNASVPAVVLPQPSPRIATWTRSLFEDEVSYRGFEIPVDHRERRYIKRDVCHHHHKEPTSNRVDSSEDHAGDQRLLAARKPLDSIVCERKQDRGNQHD